MLCDGGAMECDTDSFAVDEVCDGRDNDCDGIMDEDFSDLGMSCVVGVGECIRVGNMVCTQSGAGTTCGADPGEPQQEMCDGLDNDCDGVADENFPLKGSPCVVGVGQCQRGGVQICDPYGTDTICDAVPGEPMPEICDGIDNDCDGAADEGNPEGGGMCNTGMPGICSQGTLHCQGGGLMCVGDFQPMPEVCDGLDNDCDGMVDEGIPCECLVDEQCGCVGMPRPCETYTDPGSCEIQDGCSWNMFGFCEGVREPCEFYERGQCGMQEGCHPASCDDGECI